MIAALAIGLAVAVIVVVWQAARLARLGKELSAAQQQAAALEAEVASRREALTAAETAREQVAGELASASARADEVEAARTALQQQLDTARAELDATTTRAEDAERAAAEAAGTAEEARSSLAEAGWGRGPRPTTLWALELARTERTWRTSVSADPTAPFVVGPQPLRTALETDLAAAREDAGVEFALTWELLDEVEPLAALAVLRGAQELVALAARVADEAQLVVEPDGDDVVVRVAEPDGSAGRFAELEVPVGDEGLSAVDGGVRVHGAVVRQPA